ncbi:nucleoside 2-deoxyribosyltransferase [Clostridium tagluense]|uniref:nucleoside 2-deoxyribosyltransferase n=1 Tax=Clostridium TaxID=1485 RepID=UPI0013E991A7|nr:MULTISPECIES: nucleoside 2-deoxyribosyltransferase [Clostridium]MBU3127607.1 nucleoside 2-deoxyribosyltransferase [Clostridium tagluense]MBW9157935.1 nucleoside 2-deoxyribosyltransferase [Clostridium tagluense]MBZ9621852.1 nucleoside 2-deoxyribosyltransferase [Clostridium sp. FP2]MCB2312623.1 nucleoside 2-deoxyribosyltransferase [Clostridium tagluense]MCB2317299.1 nucleoside 2-deoxyribosyltransferase [Clostridium tagluense]
MKIYIAAPLFNEMELKRNQEIAYIIEELGFDTYLPQRDGGNLAKLLENATAEEAVVIEKNIFLMDINAMNECGMIIFLMDGGSLDEGSCFALGHMYAKGKRTIGYKTDIRNFANGKDNLMIQQSLEIIFNNRCELKNFFNKLKG